MKTCLNYFLWLLSRREYSQHELEQKALAKNFATDDIQRAIAYVQSQNYQSDERVITSLINSYTGKYGKSVIKQKCATKGIKADLFEEIWQKSLTESDSEDLSSLKAKLTRKYHIENWQTIDQATRRKIYQYLQYRGFHPHTLMQQWQNPDEDD
jgi:regulatory protein